MIVLNAGVPRSGTVLVNAILRKLFEMARAPIQQLNPHGDELTQAIASLQRSGRDRHRTTLIHTHTWTRHAGQLLRASPFVAGFANYRDPRDVCASLMRLHDHPFDAAATMTENSFLHFDAMAQELDLMIIPYERLVADPQGHIFQIARRLGFWPGLDRVAEIDAATSMDRHREVMEKVQAGELDTLRRRENRHRVLVEDKATLINDRHIQSGRFGRWRDEIAADLHGVANERFADLIKRYGYPPQ